MSRDHGQNAHGDRAEMRATTRRECHVCSNELSTGAGIKF